MTMVFRVQDQKMLDDLAVGDKVKVDVAKRGSQYVVTTLNKAR